MIEWCNQNQGFISALLSIISLALSIIAIFVSIISIRKPYNKKIKILSLFNYAILTNNSVMRKPLVIEVEVTNICNRSIRINI